jgi:hypothetical protein
LIIRDEGQKQGEGRGERGEEVRAFVLKIPISLNAVQLRRRTTNL